MGNPEFGSMNPEENQENIEKKPKNGIKIIKNSAKKLDLNVENFDVAKEQDGVMDLNLQNDPEKQGIQDWAADLRAHVKLKQEESPKNKEDKARKSFDDLFKK